MLELLVSRNEAKYRAKNLRTLEWLFPGKPSAARVVACCTPRSQNLGIGEGNPRNLENSQIMTPLITDTRNTPGYAVVHGSGSRESPTQTWVQPPPCRCRPRPRPQRSGPRRPRPCSPRRSRVERAGGITLPAFEKLVADVGIGAVLGGRRVEGLLAFLDADLNGTIDEGRISPKQLPGLLGRLLALYCQLLNLYCQ